MQRITALWNRGWVGKAVIGGTVALLACCVIGVLVPRRTGAPTAPGAATQAPPIQQATEGPVPTAGSAATPAPTNIPEPTAAPSPTLLPIEVVRAAVEQVLGKSNRDVERVVTAALDPDVADPPIYIRWSINDNVTEGLVTSSAQTDTRDILKSIATSGVAYSLITVDGLFPLVDTLGNTKETIVVHAVYRRETIDKVNWDNFLRSNVYTIADEVEVHPTFQP